MANNSGYQVGTSAAPQTARQVLNNISPQVRGSYNDAAVMKTAFGANADVVYTAVAKDTTGNSITVRYVVAGNSTALSVSVASNAITVNLATSSGGAATSTAAQVVAAVNAYGAAAALVTASVPSGQDGTGVPGAMSAQLLSGGKSAITGGVSNAPTPHIPPIHNVYA